MQDRSDTWKRLWESEGASLETVAVINGVEYTAISAPTIIRALMEGGLSIGNAVSANCRFSVMTDASIPKSAEVVIKMRLTDGETTSEWLSAGTFYISRRSRDPVAGITTLECFDALLKANAEYDTSAIAAWPRSMTDVVSDIASALGVLPDNLDDIHSGEGYDIDRPQAGAAMRDILGQIAAVHGGNWIITPDNRLRLVQVSSAGSNDESKTVRVLGVSGSIDVGATLSITGLRYTVGEEEILSGDETGLVVGVDSSYLSSISLQWLEENLIGVKYQAYDLQNAIFDPAAEPGDPVRSKDDIAGIICAETLSLGALPHGNLSADYGDEMTDEYPYIGAAKQALRVIVANITELDDKKLDDSALTQLEIFNRLTNNGETQGIYLKDGKLYINGTYIDTGELNAALITAGLLISANGDTYLDLETGEFKSRKATIEGALTSSSSESMRSVTIEDGVIKLYGGKTYFYTIGYDKDSSIFRFAPGDTAIQSIFYGPRLSYSFDGLTRFFKPYIALGDPGRIKLSFHELALFRNKTNENATISLDGTALASGTLVTANGKKVTVEDGLIVSVEDGTGPVGISNGGTGATTAAGARSNLGLNLITYTSVTQLNHYSTGAALAQGADIKTIHQSMPNNSMLICPIADVAEADRPNNYGTFQFIRRTQANGCVMFHNKTGAYGTYYMGLGSGNLPDGSWYKPTMTKV